MRRSAPSVLGIVTVAVLIFLYAPIGVVIVNAFNADATLTSTTSGCFNAKLRRWRG